MSLLFKNTGSFTAGRLRKVRRVKSRSHIARLLGVALGVSGLVGITTAVSVVSVASTAVAQPAPNGICTTAVTGSGISGRPVVVCGCITGASISAEFSVVGVGCGGVPLNLCPNGEESCDGTDSSSSGGSATATEGCVTVTAEDGEGAINLGEYGSDPDAALSSGVGEYFDVSLTQGSSFASVAITVDLDECPLLGGNSLQWWNGSSWVPVVGDPGPTYDSGPPPTVTVTLNDGTSPTVAQLTGTPIAVTVVPNPSVDLGGTSTTNLDGTTNYAVPTVS